MASKGVLADGWRELRTTSGVAYWHNTKNNALSPTKPAVLRSVFFCGRFVIVIFSPHLVFSYIATFIQLFAVESFSSRRTTQEQAIGDSEWAWMPDEKEAYIPVRKAKQEGTKWQVITEAGDVSIMKRILGSLRGAFATSPLFFSLDELNSFRAPHSITPVGLRSK